MIPDQTHLQQQIQTINSLKYQIHDKNNGGGGGLGKEIKLHYLSKNTSNIYCCSNVYCSHPINIAYLPKKITSQMQSLQTWEEVTPTNDSGLTPRTSDWMRSHTLVVM